MRPHAVVLATLLVAAPLAAQPRSQPDALLDTAMVRIGGRPALEKVERARFEMMTQWLRTTFDREPGADAPSYEMHTDTRDYTLQAWRNTRRFPAPGGGPWREMTDVVRDSVAIRRVGGAGVRWQPLNVAYVDERRELFAFSPERLLLAARAAGDLKGRTDTTFHGQRYRAVTATVNRIPTLLLFDPATGLLAAAHFSAAQPNDFGLAPWGTMPVELWFARWQRHRGGVAYPTQVDVMRAGRPYKRVTVLSAAFDVDAMPDSFAIADSLRAEFRLTQNRPMHDLPLDSAQIIEGTFATFGPFGPPVGAVKVGGVWMLLEAGQAPLNAQRTVDWLERADAQSGVLGAVVTVPFAGSGGVAWLTREGRPLWTAPGARPFVDAMLRGHAVTDRPRSASLTTISNPTWLKVGSDSLRLEPIDLPSGRGAMLVYAPTLKWAYAGLLTSPLDMDAVVARIRERGWTVERIGSRRGIAAPMPARTAAGN